MEPTTTRGAGQLYGAAVIVHSSIVLGRARLGDAIAERLAGASDERGDVDDRTVTIALMIVLAIAVMGIIAEAVTGKAESISLD